MVEWLHFYCPFWSNSTNGLTTRRLRWCFVLAVTLGIKPWSLKCCCHIQSTKSLKLNSTKRHLFFLFRATDFDCQSFFKTPILGYWMKLWHVLFDSYLAKKYCSRQLEIAEPLPAALACLVRQMQPSPEWVLEESRCFKHIRAIREGCPDSWERYKLFFVHVF